MASQVLSGNGGVSYTNNTGQNVRIVINFMNTTATSTSSITLNWGGVTATASLQAIGRNLAFSGSANGGNNSIPVPSNSVVVAALPTELMLAPGQTFSASCNSYNIVVIPEAG